MRKRNLYLKKEIIMCYIRVNVPTPDSSGGTPDEGQKKQWLCKVLCTDWLER